MKKLEGKLAIVTGGAMGNGLGIVDVFLKYGAKVIIVDFAENLPNTIGRLKEKYPLSTIVGYHADIRDRALLDTICQNVSNQFGNIDILVNNAGVCQLKSFEETEDQVRDFHFDINIKGTWNMTQSVLPYLNKEAANIINLSSVTGIRVCDKGETAYATTKAALVGFTKGLAADLVDRHIRVNAILPGYIKTPMVENMAKLSNPENPEQVITSISSNIPMKRMGTIYELGELAAFLACEEESSYITAETIIFDGGSTLPETTAMGV